MRWAIVAFGVLIVVAVLVDIWVERRRKAQTVCLCDGVTWGTGADEGLAAPCMRPLTARESHRVARVSEHPEQGGASASIGAYCEDHCPGDCSNPRCHLTAAHP